MLLVNQLPDFIARIDRQFACLLERYPDLQIFFSRRRIGAGALAPDAGEVFRGLGGVSLSVLGGIALAIIFFSTVAYVVLDPAADPSRLSGQPAARLSGGRGCAPIAAPAVR